MRRPGCPAPGLARAFGLSISGSGIRVESCWNADSSCCPASQPPDSGLCRAVRKPIYSIHAEYRYRETPCPGLPMPALGSTDIRHQGWDAGRVSSRTETQREPGTPHGGPMRGFARHVIIPVSRFRRICRQKDRNWLADHGKDRLQGLLRGALMSTGDRRLL